VVGLAALLITACGTVSTTSPSVPRPNVVFVIADDMRADSLWVMQSLNRLAQRGVTFSRFYDTTPACCPSRASIMTGLYARNHGVLTNVPPLGSVERFDDHSTLATWLQSTGVRTALIGRYLNGYFSLYTPPGWDFWFAIWQSGEEYSNYFRYRASDNGVQRYFASQPREYSTRVIGQQALKFLADEKTRPFMLMLPVRAPHGPATPDPQDSGAFKSLVLPLPPSYDEEDVSDKPGSTRDIPRLSRDQKEKIEVFRREQLETLLSVDRMLESIVEALRADGRLGNTWFIVTSDNGLMLGEHRWQVHKACAYEECVRVPLVIVPPSGVNQPQTVEHLVANIDLAPTVAEIMDAPVPTPVDGRSLVPLLKGRADNWRDALVLEVWENSRGDSFRAIRTDTRKYVRYDDGEQELYDETADPYEMENQANQPYWAEERTRLARRLEGLLADPPSRP